jgi:hypothetical protein
LLRTKLDVDRAVVLQPSICRVVRFTPHEVSIIGNRPGATHVRFWFKQDASGPRTFLVRVVPTTEALPSRPEADEIRPPFVEVLEAEQAERRPPLPDGSIFSSRRRDRSPAGNSVTFAGPFGHGR